MLQRLFKYYLARTLGIRQNVFHPLVWINGSPTIGENTYIGGFSEINATGAEVSIGDFCDIASFVSINAADSHRKCIGLTESIERKDISIGDRCFIGSHAVILGGSRIGSNSVIAAGTIVRGLEVPPYSLVIGNPPIVKKEYFLKR